LSHLAFPFGLGYGNFSKEMIYLVRAAGFLGLSELFTGVCYEDEKTNQVKGQAADLYADLGLSGAYASDAGCGHLFSERGGGISADVLFALLFRDRAPFNVLQPSGHYQ